MRNLRPGRRVSARTNRGIYIPECLDRRDSAVKKWIAFVETFGCPQHLTI
jgi:hypothetical protein